MYDGFGFSRQLARMSRRLMAVPRVVQEALLPAPAKTGTPAPTDFAASVAGGISAVTDFGSNPGGLRMLVHVPAQPPRPGAPLLVLLHGCGQDAPSFAAASGFTALADRIGAPLLLPTQADSNNPGRCFNWFRPGDTSRDGGEAESIRQMIADTLDRFGGDPARVFIAGLSAGGAMAVSMLAVYPEVFAGGGIVAGLPAGAATDVSSAMSRMSRAGTEPRAARVARVSDEAGATRWPMLSVWHGDADRTVDPANGDALVGQWTGLMGLSDTPDDEDEPVPGVRRRRWHGAVEQWQLKDFAHGFPTTTARPADPYVLPAPVQAADAMARFWGLDPG